MDILKRYYSDMTLADIKMAFELATTGELDEYLPKDKQGNPDKNHYQQFNADYFAKILKAYKQKQTDVIDKAYKAIPEKTMKFRRSKSGDLRYKDNGGTVIFSFATNTPGN